MAAKAAKPTDTVGKAPEQAVKAAVKTVESPVKAIATTVKAATTTARTDSTATRTDATPAKTNATAAKTDTTPADTTKADTTAAKPDSSVKPAVAVRTADPKPAAASGWSTRVINSTYVIGPGQSVASNRMRISMLTNGNLVISDENGVVRWSSHTEGSGYKAVFQGDGHFVVYTQDGGTAWSSGTAGHPDAELVIQDDGNVVILSSPTGGSVLWSAGTQH
jgi:hypothetical protein